MTSSTQNEVERLTALNHILRQVKDKLTRSNETRADHLSTLEECMMLQKIYQQLKNHYRPSELNIANDFLTDWVRSVMPNQHSCSRFEIIVHHTKSGITSKILVTKTDERPKDALQECGRPLSVVIGIGLRVLSNILMPTPGFIVLDDPGHYLTVNMEQRLLKQLSVFGSIYQLQTLYMLSDSAVKVPSNCHVLNLSCLMGKDSTSSDNEVLLVDSSLPINSIELSQITQIKKLELNFNHGLNVISGPVGIGKTSITNCFLQIFTNRSKPMLIKDKESEGIIKLNFSHSENLRYKMFRNKRSNNKYQFSSIEDDLLSDTPPNNQVPSWLYDKLPFVHVEHYCLSIRPQVQSLNQEKEVLNHFAEHVFISMSSEHCALSEIETDTFKLLDDTHTKLMVLDQEIEALQAALNLLSPLLIYTCPSPPTHDTDSIFELISEWKQIDEQLGILNQVSFEDCRKQLSFVERDSEITEMLKIWCSKHAALTILKPVESLKVPSLPHLGSIREIKQYGLEWKQLNDALSVLTPLTSIKLPHLPDDRSKTALNKFGHAWSDREADIVKVEYLIDQLKD